MCYTQFRMSQVLGDTSILFSKESDQQDEGDFWNRKPNDDFNKKKPKVDEDDIDAQIELERERNFDRIQQSIETDSGNTT